MNYYYWHLSPKLVGLVSEKLTSCHFVLLYVRDQSHTCSYPFSNTKMGNCVCIGLSGYQQMCCYDALTQAPCRKQFSPVNEDVKQTVWVLNLRVKVKDRNRRWETRGGGAVFAWNGSEGLTYDLTPTPQTPQFQSKARRPHDTHILPHTRTQQHTWKLKKTCCNSASGDRFSPKMDVCSRNM